LKRRLARYDEDTQPVVETLKQMGLVIEEVDATKTPDEV